MNEQQHSGYRPLVLTLKGFRGIRSGLGRDELTLDLDDLVGDGGLIAIAGANGRGKSTVMDSLHPYLTMPSRAGSDGLGAFSFYDHVCLPENEKELVWRHAGRVFRTHVVFRVNGRRRTEAFLFERGEAGTWRPARLPDGTVSDGKVETYERAVTAILGPQETFFTSVFSAQGKRPLSAFSNGEIKALLGDLLGLEYVRAQGTKAAEVAKSLRAGLAMLRREAADAQAVMGQLDEKATALGDVDERLATAELGKAAAAERLALSQQALAHVEAEERAAGVTEARRKTIADDRARAARERDDEIRRSDEEEGRLVGRERALEQRVRGRADQRNDRRSELSRRRGRLLEVLGLEARVAAAQARVNVVQRIAERWTQRQGEAQRRVEAFEELRRQRDAARQGIAATEREAGQVALRHADLERRFGLAKAVPCAGMDLAGRCQLLGDARQAHALLPSASKQLDELAQRKTDHARRLSAIETQLAAMGDVATARNLAEARLETALGRAQALLALAARAGELGQAREAIRTVDAELEAMGSLHDRVTDEDATERTEIVAARQRLTEDRARADARAREAGTRLDAQLSQLPPAFDASRLQARRQEMAHAQKALEAAERVAVSAVRQAQECKGLKAQRNTTLTRLRDAQRRASSVEGELSSWTLLAKCLSNDGIVALDIDDAGPTISALANNLLLACYGPRFTLEVITQTRTAKGELREDFDILVHDGWRDESKSLRLVSGGERVWINECLTRAIALYLRDNSDRRMSTLFSDEADGALDPEHKRMFMRMKREVLRLGGYECEFFVSQTPELTAMADRVIDLDAMAQATGAQGGQRIDAGLVGAEGAA